jgi:Carboxypeptidase regulatory-like domain
MKEPCLKMAIAGGFRLAAACCFSLTFAGCFTHTDSSIHILEQSLFNTEVQNEIAQITGIVVNENEMSLTGVTVEIRAADGTPSEVITDRTGRFSFIGLAPGVYRVAAELEGFGRASMDNISVVIHSDTKIEVIMMPDPNQFLLLPGCSSSCCFSC